MPKPGWQEGPIMGLLKKTYKATNAVLSLVNPKGKG